MLQIEVKSTSKPQLAIYTDSGGLKDSQIVAMHDWTAAGAACFLLWFYGGQVRFITLKEIAAAKLKHLKFDAGEIVPFDKKLGYHWLFNLKHSNL